MTEESNAAIVEAYKQTACLYTLIDVADLLINCSFHAATDRFTSIQQQQRDVVGNSLDGLAQSLLANQCALEEQKITHPKIAMLVDMATKIVKNRDKESMKALFVVSRNGDVLLDEISQSLNRVEGLRLKLLYPGNNSSSDLMSSLQDFDCVVTSVSCLPSDGILCDQFQLIVRYENDDSLVFDLVGQQVSSSCVNCKLLVLNVVGFSLQQGVTELDGRDGDWNRQQMTFIGSTKVVEDTDLLQLLEARYNIVVVVRNFNELEDSSGRQYFADVIVDERTGIVLVEQSDLSLPTFLKSLRQRTTFLSFKYETCWIIVRSKLDDAHRQSFGDCCSRNIARLLASSAHFSPEENGFEMRLAYAFGNDETARIVREIGELAYEDTRVWQKSQWIQRSWLTEQMSLHEKFLISIPSINSLSAQVMLTAAPLRDLLSMSREELFSTCRWLPVRVLERFYETTHWGRRTLLSPSDSLVDTLPHLRLDVESTDRYDEEAESEAAMVELVNDMCTPPSVTGLCERTDSLVMTDDVGVDFDSDVSMIEESVESRNYRAQQSRCVGLKSLGRFHGGRTRRRHARDDFAAAAAAAAMGVGDSRREENERYCTMRQSNSRGSSVKSFCREASLPKRVCPSGMDCSVSQSRDEAHYTGCLERCGESVSRYADVVTRGDRRVPSSDLCGELDSYSNSPDWSVYSPTLVSPGSSHSGKRLVYRRVPGSVDGQTKLAFS
ncbi:protein shortage in chiasmata 1 ortholog-like isoform X2 [Corticium candelabrum]|uniref:protein shortage in chiasmata 1 ortholog-like isoform X2 n=1 Tax=Corticium candelabrum TaxID=121492 RepID=UPI002E26F24C|nr:protein shortage in chiasmata 1 ortholog-like isoform X2 [Corticium candelabrum]